jgi:hypothetical protein
LKALPISEGQRYGRLKVLSPASAMPKNNKWWSCECECGTVLPVRATHLFSGHTQSCACLSRDTASANRFVHGQARTRTYAIWCGVLKRCNNPSDKYYHGRGITVCDRWLKFENFYADMGDAPKDLTIERNDNNGNYEPGNCRWATRKEQAGNRTTSRMLTWRGKTQCAKAWAEELGIPYQFFVWWAYGKEEYKYKPRRAFA